MSGKNEWFHKDMRRSQPHERAIHIAAGRGVHSLWALSTSRKATLPILLGQTIDFPFLMPMLRCSPSHFHYRDSNTCYVLLPSPYDHKTSSTWFRNLIYYFSSIKSFFIPWIRFFVKGWFRIYSVIFMTRDYNIFFHFHLFWPSFNCNL